MDHSASHDKAKLSEFKGTQCAPLLYASDTFTKKSAEFSVHFKIRHPVQVVKLK